jgi:hypothetical protein
MQALMTNEELTAIRADIRYLAEHAVLITDDLKALKSLQSSIVRWIQRHAEETP